MKWPLALLAAVLLAPTAVLAGERAVTLAVENMTCALCPLTVETAIAGVPGVSAVDVDAETETVRVTFDDSVATVEQIAAASTDAGYPAHLGE